MEKDRRDPFVLVIIQNYSVYLFFFKGFFKISSQLYDLLNQLCQATKVAFSIYSEVSF